jgi:hypothetical protein
MRKALYKIIFLFGVAGIGTVICGFSLRHPSDIGSGADYLHTVWFSSSNNPPNLKVYQLGEEMTYEVSYLTIKLGSITSKVVAIDTVKKKVFFKTEGFIKTYNGIPFVKLKTLFQSTVNEESACVSFAAKEAYKDTMNKYMNYSFPKKKDVLYFSERLGNTPVREHYDTIPLEGKQWQDGLSLLFYARCHAHQKYEDHVPVLIYRKKAYTTIRFGQGRERKKIDATNYAVRTVKLDGETGFTGIFGLTGGFEGWFSEDEASVPIYAKMHVYIGSVCIELIKWKRKGWGPPG